jgi:hypothetical protein
MTMTENTKQAIELACTKLINQFAVFNDAGRHNDLADLFTDEGQYARPTDPENYVQGRAAILAAFTGRPADKLTRHLITNIVVDVIGPTSASGLCYVTLYAGSTGKPAEKHAYQANPSQLIGEYHDMFVLTPAGWKFSKRQGRLIFST